MVYVLWFMLMVSVLWFMVYASFLWFMYCSLMVDKFGYSNLSLGAVD